MSGLWTGSGRIICGHVTSSFVLGSGTVLSLDPLPASSPAVRKATSSSGSYLLKPACRGGVAGLQPAAEP